MKEPYSGKFDAHDFDMEAGYHETGQCNSSRCPACAAERRDPTNETLLLTPDDVKVVKIEQYGCENCGEDFATHWVKLDFRHIGTETQVFEGCQACCESFAEGIMESLGWRRDEQTKP